MEDLIRCANCDCNLEGKNEPARNSRVNLHIEDPGISTQPEIILNDLSVVEALCAVFNFQDDEDSNEGCPIKSKLKLCDLCFVIFQDLYKYFKMFSLRRHSKSFISRRTHQQLEYYLYYKRNHHHEGAAESESDDDYSPPHDIDVKVEIDTSDDEVQNPHKAVDNGITATSSPSLIIVPLKLPLGSSSPPPPPQISKTKIKKKEPTQKIVTRSSRRKLTAKLNYDDDDSTSESSDSVPVKSGRSKRSRKDDGSSPRNLRTKKNYCEDDDDDSASNSSDSALVQSPPSKRNKKDDCGPPYMCRVCHPPKEFDNFARLLAHRGSSAHVKENDPCKCPICELNEFSQVIKEYFQPKDEYEYFHRGKGTGKLKVKKFKLQKETLSTVLIKGAPFLCPFPGCDPRRPDAPISNPRTFWKHLEVIHLHETNKCPKCSKCFDRGAYLAYHIPRCGVNIPYKPRKRKHEPPFICEICCKEYSNYDNLKKHGSVHLSEREFQCEQCGAAFKSQKLLNSHMVTHSDHRPYMCDQCGRHYKTSTAVHFHKRVAHSEEGRLKHNAYMRELHKRKQLRKKERAGAKNLGDEQHVSQPAERPFSCEDCGKSYKTRRNLTSHKRIAHTEEGRLHHNEYRRKQTQRKRLLKQSKRAVNNSGGEEDESLEHVPHNSDDSSILNLTWG